MSDKKSLCIKALIELSKTTKFEEITVLDLTKMAGVKRTTFYYNFASIRDVIRCYFLDFPLTNTHLIGDVTRLIESIVRRFDTDGDFILELINQKVYRDIVLEVVNAWAFLFFKKNTSDKSLATFLAGGFSSLFIEIYVSKEKNFSKIDQLIRFH